LKKLYHKKQGLILLKCLLVPKHVKKQKDGKKKTHRTLYPDTLLGRGLHPPTFGNQTTLLPIKPHMTQKSKKKGGATMKPEKLRPCKLPQRSNYKETQETETL
jgi:hypothetical protein